MMCDVKTLGSVSLPARQPNDAVPLAQRAVTPGWRDPRLWIGVAIIAASVVAGAKLMASADNTIAVWAVDRDLVPGDAIVSDDLSSRKVRFVDPADQGRYLLASEPILEGTRMTRSVGEGELLPRSAMGTSLDTGVIEIPINCRCGPSAAVGRCRLHCECLGCR